MINLSPKQILEEQVPKRLQDKPELLETLNSVILFNISGEKGGKWVLDLRKSSDWIITDVDGVSVTSTIEISDDDFLGLVTKTLNAQALAMTGKLKIKPLNAKLAMKLGSLLKI